MKPRVLGLATPSIERTPSAVEGENQAAAREAEALRKDPLKNYQ
jgi:hypothetical protein